MTSNKNAIVIAGNGVSVSQIDYQRLPKDFDVFRMNNFFFEDKYYLGKKVDYYYTDYGFLEGQYFNLHHLHERGEYQIGDFYTTPGENREKDWPATKDILKLAYGNPIYKEFTIFYQKYYSHLISGGILSVFAAIELGYKEIYITGMDLYNNPNCVYPWKNGEFFEEKHERDRMGNVMNVINQYHPLDLQIKAINLLKSMTDVKIYSISEQSAINELIELAPIVGFEHGFPENKPNNYTKDWIKSPIDSAIESGVERALTPLQEIERQQTETRRYQEDTRRYQEGTSIKLNEAVFRLNELTSKQDLILAKLYKPTFLQKTFYVCNRVGNRILKSMGIRIKRRTNKNS